MGVKPDAVDLRIEELVLHGFAPADRYRIAEAVEGELARLFAEEGVPPSLLAGQAPALPDGGSFEVAPGAPAEQVGAQVARAIYRGLASEPISHGSTHSGATSVTQQDELA